MSVAYLEMSDGEPQPTMTSLRLGVFAGREDERTVI